MKIHLEFERRVRVPNWLRTVADGLFLRRWPRVEALWPYAAFQRRLCWLDEHAPQTISADSRDDSCRYCGTATPGQAVRFESEDQHMLVPDEVEVPYDQDEEE